MTPECAAIINRHAQELADHDAQARRNAQADYEFHARRSGFKVRAALMFGVPCPEVTNAQYMAAVQRTEWDMMPTAREVNHG